LSLIPGRALRRPTRFSTRPIGLAAFRATSAPVAQRGDQWRLGDHHIQCGDAADAAAVSRLLDGQKTQMAFTDPPQNVDYGHHGGQQRGILLFELPPPAPPS
jgi:hypothetical protein